MTVSSGPISSSAISSSSTLYNDGDLEFLPLSMNITKEREKQFSVSRELRLVVEISLER